jgi:murein tripeptide amidase MpaA
MPSVRFDRFYRYDELTAILKQYAAEFPQLATIESIGKSHEGRDIWVLTVTSEATGPAEDKPAFWVEGNVHATEVAASVACVYFLNHVLTRYGQDADVTRALDTRAFYVCPRVNPDGPEWALADKPKFIRSSTRPYPHDEGNRGPDGRRSMATGASANARPWTATVCGRLIRTSCG